MVTEIVSEFGEQIAALLDRHGLSYGQAANRSGGRITRSYFGHMRKGQIPSIKVLHALSDMFPDDDLSALYAAADRTPPPTPAHHRPGRARAGHGECGAPPADCRGHGR
jgi:hypothetical protein